MQAMKEKEGEPSSWRRLRLGGEEMKNGHMGDLSRKRLWLPSGMAGGGEFLLRGSCPETYLKGKKVDTFGEEGRFLGRSIFEPLLANLVKGGRNGEAVAHGGLLSKEEEKCLPIILYSKEVLRAKSFLDFMKKHCLVYDGCITINREGEICLNLTAYRLELKPKDLSDIGPTVANLHLTLLTDVLVEGTRLDKGTVIKN
ncbi:hypothetical protein VNO77_03328 [Canavalia gladiata]|uniref:Uncharacterized protein n=1 Tax=Canavalia gladiata TaxID=3824 RepID=A0AAN9R817_CANGL